MVNFLLIIENFTDYNKKDIDRGNTPLDVYKICCCIRETFCLSYNLRKENNLYLYFQDKKILIRFEGHSLKYLSSDERSQALLLLKALEKAKLIKISNSDDWVKSTPGIYIKKFGNTYSFILWLKLMELKNILCISNLISASEILFLAHMYDLPPIKKFSELKNLSKFFIIMSLPSHINKSIINFLYSIVRVFPSMLETIVLTSLEKIKALEDKILYINFRIDQQESIKNVNI